MHLYRLYRKRGNDGVMSNLAIQVALLFKNIVLF